MTSNNILRKYIVFFLSKIYYFLPHNSRNSGKWLRQSYYKSKIKKLGSNVSFCTDLEISNPKNVTIGNSCNIGRYCIFEAGASIILEANVVLEDRVIIKSGKEPNGQIKIGRDSYIGPNSYLDGVGGILIGSDVLISPNCKLLSTQHNFQDSQITINKQGRELAKVVVEDDVWIGANTVILPGITIHKGAVVGAGSVVTKDVKRYEVVAGNPARKIKERA